MKQHSKAALLAADAVVASTPRAVSGYGVRADGSDPKALFAELQRTVQAMRDDNDERLKKVEAKIDPLDLTRFDAIQSSIDKIEKAMDDQAKAAALAKLGGSGVGDLPATDPEYVKAFKAHVRKGDVQAALSVGSAPDGGYLAPVEWDRTITDKQKIVSPMRAHASVQQVGTSGFTRLYNDRNVGSGWVGESAARPATTTPQLAPLAFANGELYANPAVTQQLLDDAAIDVEAWLQNEVSVEFDRQEAIAFVGGDGVNKPRGFLLYAEGAAAAAVHPFGAIKVVKSGAAAAVTADGVVNLVMDLPTAYGGNAKFFASRASFGKIRLLKDGQGNYIWQPTFQAGTPSTLAGYPLIEMPDMPGIAASATPIAFGDMAATYLILDRVGVRILRDPYTNKPYVHFYTTKRVGGGVQNPEAMRLMTVAA